MNNIDNKTVKSVSAGSVILWILGVSTIIVGLGGGYVLIIIAGVILLPITNTLLEKYLKINFSAMARFIMAVIIIVVGISVSSSLDYVDQVVGDKSEVNNSVVQPEVFTEIFSIKGDGNQSSESFNVSSRKVRVTATTCCGGSMSGSYSGVDLHKENGGYTGPGLSISTEGAQRGSGQTIYRNLTPGRYYIQVISGVNWEVKVEQTN